MIKRRTFLGALSALALPSFISARFVLAPIAPVASHFLNRNNKKNTAFVYVPSYLRFGLFAQLTEQFIQNLNSNFADIAFSPSSKISDSQIILSSPSQDHQSKKMLFICRSPGGLNRPDFKNWLNSNRAQEIYQTAYEKKGFKPFLLTLGPATNHQPVNVSSDYKSEKILFGSSVSNSFRSIIKGIELQTYPTLHAARRKLESSDILSLEALQPKVAAALKSSEIILLEDGLASQPQIYQALIKSDLWNATSYSQKNTLVEKIMIFGQQLDKEIIRNDFIFQSNLATHAEIQKLPHRIHDLRNLENKYAGNYLLQQAIQSDIVSDYEEFESYRSKSVFKLG